MPNYMLFGEPIGQSWVQLSELALAFVLSALIGLEREIRQKSAGLRTYTLVGVSSALTMLVSKYGFTDIIENGRVVLDPSRVAAHYDGGHRLAHGRSRYGRWSRPSDPGHRRDLRSFHRGVHLSGDRAKFLFENQNPCYAFPVARADPRHAKRTSYWAEQKNEPVVIII